MKTFLKRTRPPVLFILIFILLGTVTGAVASTKVQVPPAAALPNQWTPLEGPAGTGTNSAVWSLVLDGAGSLYAGGAFTTAGGVAANHTAKWDGTEWSALGSGMDGNIRALANDSTGNLYAGGGFTTAGSAAANNVAQWDGVQWSALGTGMDDTVWALATDSAGTLYAGGLFTTAGGVTTNYVAQWDGAQWTTLGTGMDGSVYALATDSAGNLYAGGNFTTAGGAAANYVAQWDGAQWTTLGTGMDGPVYALATDSAGILYVGGYFSTAGGVAASNVAQWDGAQWSALGTGTIGGVYALAPDAKGNLYAGGFFTYAGGVDVQKVAKWDGTQWSDLSGPAGTGVDNWMSEVNTLVTDSTGNLYAGGNFAAIGGIITNYVASYVYPTILTVLTGGIGSVPDTGDGSLSEGESTSAAINMLTISFSEDVSDPAGGSNVDDVTNPANYRLVKDSATRITINAVSYSNNGGSGPFVATVVVNDGVPLPAGDYIFTVSGTTSITSSLSGLSLAGDGINPGTDFIRSFIISGRSGSAAASAESLPATGFAPGALTELPVQPAEKDYSELGDLWLEVPTLNVQAPIVGVPFVGGEWDVSWLGSSVGWLENTAYPTLNGNTVLTGHVWDAFNNPGPFANLRQLAYGDQFSIHADGMVYTYEIRRNYQVFADDLSALSHSDYDTVTLVTCEGYNITNDTYLYRRVIHAVLVGVQ